MKQWLSVMIFTAFALEVHAQGKFFENRDKNQDVIILANPTVSNMETVRFLLRNRILVVNQKKTLFVGIYHKNQAYDFTLTRKYMDEQNLSQFRLYELTGDLTDQDVFRENACSGDFREIFRNSSGVLFFGGPDIQPGIYGEENTHSVVTDPARHAMEISFIYHLLGGFKNPDYIPLLKENPEYLVTGFCLGLQSMNVATGGTLIQDIPFQVYGKNTPRETVTIDRNNLHRNYWQEFNEGSQLMGINLHPVNFTDHPFFSQRLKVSQKHHPLVYSSHHQGIEKIGSGFEITALSADEKVIEGFAHIEFPNVFAVQFHPEVPGLYENREEWKFEPEDHPRSYHQIIGPGSVRFHKKYWGQISKGLKQSWKERK